MVKELIPEIHHYALADAAHRVIGVIKADSLQNGQEEQRQGNLRNDAAGNERKNEENIFIDKALLLRPGSRQTLAGHQDFVEQRKRQGGGRRL